MMKGITFNGLHSFKDLGLTLKTAPVISFPSKVKNKIRLTGTNKFYDFSSVNGIQQYEERVVKCVFNVLDRDKRDLESTHYVAMNLTNWLMKSNSPTELTLDMFPDYYFKAEAETGYDFETNLFEFGEIEVTFTAYPYRIGKHKVGDDNFRVFNFLTDVRQDYDIELVSIADQLPFKLLNEGDVVTIGGWAQYFGQVGKVSRYHRTQFFTISDIREVDDVDTSPTVNRWDKTQYYLEEIGTWVRSQDIVHARNDYAEITLWNSSITPVLPDITMTPRAGMVTLGGITIERDGRYYNLKRNEVNNLFGLNPGDNKLKIYGQGYLVGFNWRNEVL